MPKTKKSPARPVVKTPEHRVGARFTQLLSYRGPWAVTPELLALDSDGNVWAWSEDESAWISSNDSQRRIIR